MLTGPDDTPISHARTSPQAAPSNACRCTPAKTVASRAGQVFVGTAGLVLWLRDLLIATVASVLIITFLYQPVRVEGTSMLPRLEDRDRLFINKFVYHISSIERGDVVVFHYPRDPEKSYIKRVIALPGDTLRIDHGRVFVNGKLLREPYVPAEYRDNRSRSRNDHPRGQLLHDGRPSFHLFRQPRLRPRRPFPHLRQGRVRLLARTRRRRRPLTLLPPWKTSKNPPAKPAKID